MSVSGSSAIVKKLEDPLESIESIDFVGGNPCVRNRRFSAGESTIEAAALHAVA
jgi:hypothetical protein